MITKKCAVSGLKFTITESDLEFYAKMEIISKEDLAKLKSREISDCVGLPTLCPKERNRRRLAWRNESKLYQRKCDSCEKITISVYHEDADVPVYCQKCWWSHDWDGKDVGQDLDFSRDFFPQFGELLNKVPNLSLVVVNSENCQFNNYAVDSKNCYMCFRLQGEDIMYSYLAVHNCKDCLDCYNIEKCELCYEVIDGKNCYDVNFSRNIENCSESSYLFNCKNCSNCFFSSNLRSKQYYFCNKKLSKEKYFAEIAKIKSNEKLKNKYIKFFQEFVENGIVPHLWGSMIENSTGNHLVQAKNCIDCYDCWTTEDLKYCNGHSKGTDCMDTDYYYHGSNSCEIISVIESSNLNFCYGIWSGGSYLDYSFSCVNNCKDCFGCIGLKHAQYCIFNKQYSKEDYFKLREKIIAHMKRSGEWGEFFPMELSPFAYNETVADEYFPLTKEEILAKNFKYREEKQNFKYDGPKYEIPAKIEDVNDEICAKILTCEATGKYYKIQPAELKFYRKMNLPIPRLCPDERHKRRMALRNPRTLFERTCHECDTKIQTTFAKNRLEKVLCEECYLKEVN